LPRARKEQKAEQVELLTEKLKKAKVAVLTDYRGLTVSQIQDLRGKLRTGDVEYRVVKNTLARRAASSAGVSELEKELEVTTT
jgi:large subunit ribosomal protein L10